MIRRPPFRGLLLVILLLGLWQLVGDPDSSYYPPPSAWWAALEILNEQGVLLPAFWDTLWVTAISIVLVVVVGGAFGALLGRMPRLERLLSPTIEVCRTIPPPTVVPLAVLLFGAKTSTVIVLTVFAAMWIVVLNTSAATRAIPPARFDAARSLGLSRAAIARKVLIPSLVPGISLGLRVAAPIILIVVLLVQMLSSLPGMGRVLVIAQQNFVTARVFGVLAVVGVMGYLLNLLVAFLQERLVGTWGVGE